MPAGGVATGFQLAMRSRSPYGPYECKKVLEQGDTPVNGPHQGGWIHTSQGEDWFMHFQDKGAYGRVVHLQPVTWRDNWPVMGKLPATGYCGEPLLTCRMPKSAYHDTCNPVESDEFNDPRLGLQWQWHGNYQQSLACPLPLAYSVYILIRQTKLFGILPTCSCKRPRRIALPLRRNSRLPPRSKARWAASS